MRNVLLSLWMTFMMFSAVACAQKPSLLNPGSLNASAPATYDVRLETTKGNILLRVHKDWSPHAANRFYNLVRNGFYDNNYFFRNLDFMVQFGLSPDPKISKAWANVQMPDDPVAKSNLRGTMSFASLSAPNTRGTQVFINKTDNARLDPLDFQPFAEVIQGMDVVDLLFAGYGERPVQQLLEEQGEPYINRYFPRMDKIVKAEIVPAQ